MDHLHAAVAAAVDERLDTGGIVRALAGRFGAPPVEAALRELHSLGWIEIGEAVRWTRRDLAAVLPPLLGLLEDRYDLHEIQVPGSPCWFAVAAPRADADHLLPEGGRLGSGRGAAACGFTRARALAELSKYKEAKEEFEEIARTREWRGEKTGASLYWLGLMEERQA